MVPVAWLILAATPAAAPAPDPACAPLAERVAAGAAPLGDLVKRYEDKDARAALAATVKPDTHGFIAAQKNGAGIAARSQPVAGFPARASHLEGALPGARGDDLRPRRWCAPLSRRRDPDRADDQTGRRPRADYLKNTPALLARWNACAAQRPAERCLDELLPLSGSAAHLDRDVAAWIAFRDAPSDDDPGRQARCTLVLADADAGLLAFRCEGSLVDIHCESWANVTFKYADERELQTTCADDGKALVVVANVGPAPAPACLSAARAALRAPRERFPAARVAALRDCAPDEASSDDEPEKHDHPPPAARLLIHRVLARRRRCSARSVSAPVREARRRLRGVRRRRVRAPARRGVRHQGLGVQPGAVGGLGDGRWGGGDNRRLLRLPAASPPRQPAFMETDVTIGGLVRSGDVFANGERFGEPIYNASDVICDSCVAGKADPDLCRAYTLGGSPDAM